MTVTHAQIAQYRDEGATRVEQVLSPEWVARLLAAVDRGCAAVGTPEFTAKAATNPRNKTLNPPSLVSNDGGTMMLNMLWHDEAFIALVEASPVAEVVGTLMGATHVRPWIDATFIKEGNLPAAATPWHNDVCTFAFTGEMQPSLWVALTDVDESNAPMLTLAGSNHDTWRYHSPISPPVDEVPPGYRPWDELLARAAAPDAPIRVWPCKAGDVLLIHPRTIHASRPRLEGAQNERRVAFTLRWMGSDVVWDPDALSIKPAPLMASGRMEVGKPPPDDLFPIVWRATA